jgi:hypothetical protein
MHPTTDSSITRPLAAQKNLDGSQWFLQITAARAPHSFFFQNALLSTLDYFTPLSSLKPIILSLVFFDPIGCARQQFFSSFPFPLQDLHCTPHGPIGPNSTGKTSMASDNEPT